MASAALFPSPLSKSSRRNRNGPPPTPHLPLILRFPSSVSISHRRGRGRLHVAQAVSGGSLPAASPSRARNYDFSDSVSEVELRVDLSDRNIESTGDIFVDTDEISLRVRVRSPSSVVTLVQTSQLYDRIKPSETIWYIDEDQLVVSLKKCETELKWPDLVENWPSLTSGVPQLLKGTSIYIVGNSTEINQKVARELASGIRYTPLTTSELLEEYAKQSIDSWVTDKGEDSVAQAEGAVIEGLSSHVRTVVSTLGGQHGIAGRADTWRHLYAGLTIWLSLSNATDEVSAKEEARRNIQEGVVGYSNAEIVIKLGGWDPESAQPVAQACLAALKKLLLQDKELIGRKSLYLRSGCRGDWPNIEPPGWDPSTD